MRQLAKYNSTTASYWVASSESLGLATAACLPDCVSDLYTCIFFFSLQYFRYYHLLQFRRRISCGPGNRGWCCFVCKHRFRQRIGELYRIVYTFRKLNQPQGANIMLGGIVSQMSECIHHILQWALAHLLYLSVFITVYVLFAAEFIWRYFKDSPIHETSKLEGPRVVMNRQLKTLIFAMAFNTFCLYVRCAATYRPQCAYIY